MNFRAGLAAFVVILGLIAAPTFWYAKRVRAESTDWKAAARAATDRGESDLAVRILAKGIFYAGLSAESAAEALSGDLAFRDEAKLYLKAIESLAAGDMGEGELRLTRAAESRSPLIAARAKTRLDLLRYGSGVPNLNGLPF